MEKKHKLYLNALKILSKITGQKHITITESGDSAIYKAFEAAKELGKKTILVPDQGGWFSYKKFPKKLGLEVKELKTDFGLIDLSELKKEKGCALILTTFAGYFAEQDTKQMAKICRKNDILFIEDITGAIGYKKPQGDILVCSFSHWKPINLGEGGFISTNDKSIFDLIKKDDVIIDEGKLLEKIKNLKRKYEILFNEVEKIKNDLKNYEIIHKNKKGINVVVKFNSEKEKNEIIKYCEKNKYEWVLCPNYIKVNADAISIEVKRIGDRT